MDFPKPHPEGINKALEELGVSNAEAIFLEIATLIYRLESKRMYLQ
nr:HAD family hydrolase [Mesobacillus boroniphilus]